MKRLLLFLFMFLAMLSTAHAVDFNIEIPVTITNTTISTTTTGYAGSVIINEYSVQDINRYVYQYYIKNAESDLNTNLGYAKIQLTYEDGTAYNMTTGNFPYNTPTNYTLTNPNPNLRVEDITLYKLQTAGYSSTITGAVYSYYDNLNNDITYINSSTVSIGLNSTNATNYFIDLNLNATNRIYNDGTLSGYTRNDGTTSGGVTIEDGAMVFDGANDYVELATPINIKSACWWNNLNNDGTDHQILRNSAAIQLLGVRATGNYAVYESGWYTIYPVSFNTWEHVCFTYNGTWNLYVNSIYRGSTAAKNDIDFNYIGYTGAASTVNGSISDIAIYDRALDSSEITEIYNAGRDAYTPIASGLIAQYTGKDYAGTTSAPTTIYDTNMLSNGQDISWQNRTSTAINFDGSSQYITNSLDDSLFNNGLTVSFYLNGFKSANQGVIGHYNSNSDSSYLFYFLGSDLRYGVNVGGATFNNYDTGWNYNSGLALHTLTYNNTNLIYYRNGVLITNTVLSGNIKDSTANFYIGKWSSNYLDGSISDIAIYDRALSSTEITALYTGTEPVLDGLVWSQGDYIVETNTLKDGLYRVCVNCQSYNSNLYNLSEETYKILFAGIDATGQDHNTAYLIVDLTAPTINNSIPSEINDYEFLDTFFSCSDTYLASCNISIDSLNEAQNTNFTLIHNGNLSYTITATDLAGNTATESGVLFVNPTQYFRLYNIYTSTNVTSWTLTLNNVNYSTTNGQIAINLSEFNVDANNTLMINTLGYQKTQYIYYIDNTSNINVILNGTTALVYLYFKNISNLAIINNVTFTIDGTPFASNYSTTTGTAIISDFSALPAEYNIISNSVGFEQNSRFFTFTGYDNVNITIYMVSASSSTPLLIVVQDNELNLLSGILVDVKIYETSINSYIPLTSGVTNSLGQVLFELDYSKKYQFVLSNEEGIVSTEGQYLTSSPMYLEFSPDTQRIKASFLWDIFTSITFVNTTINDSKGYFRYEFNDPTGAITQGCMYVYLYNSVTPTLLDTVCLNATSGTIYSDTLNITYLKTYKVIGYVTYNNEQYQQEVQTFLFLDDKSTWAVGLGVIFSLLVFMVLVIGGVQNGVHPVIIAILSIVPLGLGAIFGSLPIQIGSIITFISIFVYILMVYKK